MENINIMNKRTSVRSFVKDGLTVDLMEKINAIVTKTRRGPFGSEHKLRIIDTKDENLADLGKMTSYGVIKDATIYYGGYCNQDDQTLYDYGFCFEEVMLELTELDLGTCWLGGTFGRSFIAKAFDLPTDKFIPAISPIGIPLEKRVFTDKLVRFLAKADKRKPHDQLLFKVDDENTMTPLTFESEEDPVSILLETVRYAPSASNKQPWRIVVKGNDIHLYWDFDEKYNSMSKNINIQALDMGIGLSHLFRASKDLNIDGTFSSIDPKLDNISWRYVATWTMNK